MPNTDITFKFNYGGDLRRWTTPVAPLDIETVAAKVQALYGLTQCPRPLKYTDVDGDAVTLSSEQDLKELLLQDLQVVRLTVPNGSTNTHQSAEAEETDGSLPLWSLFRTEKFLKRVAYNTSFLDCQPEAGLMIPKLLQKSQGRLSLADTEKLVIVLQATASAGRPQIKQTLNMMARDGNASVYVRDLLGRAVYGEPVPDLIHHGHTCAGCGMTPIVGHRYTEPSCGAQSVCWRCQRSRLADGSNGPPLQNTKQGAVAFWGSAAAATHRQGSKGCGCHVGVPRRGGW